jgi:predicted TIM-barrel fold metal-dependent hydrolase
MPKAPKIIDFHTHIMSLAGVEQIFPEARQTLFFKHVVPIVEPIADITEGLHDQLLRHLAMHYNNKLSRLIYSRCGELFLMEALRLFKRHGLERLIHNMNKLGISRSVIYSLEPLTKTQDILDQVKPYADRFSVFASVARSEPDPVGYLKPFVESGLVSGIKIHPMVGGYHADDLYAATKDYVALAAEYGLPVAIHTGDIPIEQLTNQVACSEIRVIEPLIRDFPNCNFVLNHLGWESWRAAIKLAKACPNVYVETSWQPARIMRRAVRDIGRDRVIFGSDYPMFQQWQAVREVKSAFHGKDFDAVTNLNASRLLKLPIAEKQRV